jgi:hypothetical protein
VSGACKSNPYHNRPAKVSESAFTPKADRESNCDKQNAEIQASARTPKARLSDSNDVEVQQPKSLYQAFILCPVRRLEVKRW